MLDTLPETPAAARRRKAQANAWRLARFERLKAERAKLLSGDGDTRPATVTVREFIKITGVSHSSVCRWIKAGTIRSVKVHGNRLINFAEVERLRKGE